MRDSALPVTFEKMEARIWTFDICPPPISHVGVGLGGLLGAVRAGERCSSGLHQGCVSGGYFDHLGHNFTHSRAATH